MAKPKNTKKQRNFITKKHMAREQREAQQTRTIVIIAIVVGVIIFGLVAYGAIDQFVIRPRRPVAQVGDKEITVSEFESYVKYMRVQMLNQTYQYYTFYQQFGEFGGSFLQTAQSLASQLSQPVSLGRDALDDMINNILVKESAAMVGITVSDAEIDEAVQAAFGFFPDGTPTPTITSTIASTPTLSATQQSLLTMTSTPEESEESADSTEATATSTEEAVVEESETDEALANSDTAAETPTPDVSPTITLTPTPYSTEIFGENIKEFNNLYAIYDFDINQLRDIFEIELLRQKLIDVVITDLDPVKEEVWARHILVEAEDIALEVLSLLEQGESFQTLAEIYSIDGSNNLQGGDLGWFDENMMVPEFSEVAFNLEIGEISEPVQTSFGFHIIQALGKRDTQMPPAEFELEKQNAFASWLSDYRDSRDDIVIIDGWDKYVPTSPELPQQLLIELFQQQQNIIPPTNP